jgi:hypothetical protein
MWVDVLVDVIWLLWPFGRDQPVEQSAVEPGASTLRVVLGDRAAYARALNASGWLAEEIQAAGRLRQGKPYSLFGLVTGLALLDWLRARRAKSLPREFVLAVTAQGVFVFGVSLVAEGDGEGSVDAIRLKRPARGSWPRAAVRAIDRTEGFSSKGATLELAGVDRVAVAWDGGDSTDEVIELLCR